jgi:hypothetical protein
MDGEGRLEARMGMCWRLWWFVVLCGVGLGLGRGVGAVCGCGTVRCAGDGGGG